MAVNFAGFLKRFEVTMAGVKHQHMVSASLGYLICSACAAAMPTFDR
jgi:hypothetical protein